MKESTQEPPQPVSSSNRFSVGTLTYTKSGVVALFGWLLWGDFCFQAMESLNPAFIPLKLRSLEAPNWAIALIMTTLPGMLNMTVSPWVSFKSDRHRGPLGRRIPYILYTLPFLTGCLLLLGFSEQIGKALHGLMPTTWGLTQSTVTIACIGVFMVAFKFFDMFVNSVFWYLFNDVVPRNFMGRFLGLFRVVSNFESMIFGFFIFKHASTHMTEIYVGAAIVYSIGMGLMCWKVKEGEYPPLPLEEKARSGFLAQIKTYITECYSQRYYWNLFLCTACWAIAGTLGIFNVFLQKDIGLDLAQIGMIGGAVSFMNMLLTVPAGVLGDRFHPLRVLVWVKLVNLFFLPLGLVWLFFDFSPATAFNIAISISAINLPFTVLTEAMLMPMNMRVLPLDRFGQFCSANALVRALASILGGLLGGLFLDLMKYLHDGSDYAYRYIPVWSICWSAIALFFLWRLYQDWKCRSRVD
ncbi:MAG: hypothetical protein H2172_01695 [Opitutus sp.]|nr:hypothetical protein [Opitutus sp.]MCS6248390.1 hypothetical protein [Opitutus sp.]MCS6275161.1 hypothetical protein [Opitutus sp.]MCS6277078.1 hypothetical protein [Opitutus sp.]MCS6300200.1 hypothetical protein [Opitutus sp.]